MKYLLLCCFLCVSEFLFAQRIRLEGVETNYFPDYPDAPLYAIRQYRMNDRPEGRMVFTPGGEAWTFSWTYEGQAQSVVPYEDSTCLVVDLLGNGLYTCKAEKAGGISIEERFYVFYDFMDFQISLDNVFDCEYITIRLDYLNLPNFNGFPGWENVDYWVVWDGKERQLSSLNDYLYQELSQWVVDCSEDVDCFVRIKDRFGFVWESNKVTYESVIPLAEAEMELLNTVNETGTVGEPMGQAPLEVYFHNSSLNAASYEWWLFKDTADVQVLGPTLIDSLLNEQIRTQEEFLYTYEHPGMYKVQLVAVNDRGNQCRDTTEAYDIHVVASVVDVPNVFTPNGDGKNDEFRALVLSVEDFHGVILNRWGRKVYEWSDPSSGWDGKINGKYASPGTYYYIITARGREKTNPPHYVKKGALMLIR